MSRAWTPAARVEAKTGEVFCVRPAELADAEGLLALERAVIGDGRGVVMGLDEVAPSVEAFRAELGERLVGQSASPRGIELVAVAPDGAIAGTAAASRMGPSKVRHTALLAAQVHPDWQGRGLGRALMEGLLAWARRETPAADRVHRLELYVRADNPRAIALYRSLGFVCEGTRAGLVRTDDGRFVDDHVMGLLLTEEISRPR